MWTKVYQFREGGDFPFFDPHRHISAAFELSPTNFWPIVALPEGFPKVSKNVDQSSSVSRKWGGGLRFSPFSTYLRHF